MVTVAVGCEVIAVGCEVAAGDGGVGAGLFLRIRVVGLGLSG